MSYGIESSRSTIALLIFPEHLNLKGKQHDLMASQVIEDVVRHRHSRSTHTHNPP